MVGVVEESGVGARREIVGLLFASNENSCFNSQCLKRYRNYSNSSSLPLQGNENILILWWRRRHTL